MPIMLAPLGAEDADHFKGDVINPDLLAQGRFAAKKLLHQPLSQQTHLAAVTHILIGKGLTLGQGPFADIQKGRGGSVNVDGNPVAVPVNDLDASPDYGRGRPDGRAVL